MRCVEKLRTSTKFQIISGKLTAPSNLAGFEPTRKVRTKDTNWNPSSVPMTGKARNPLI
jgi:hypothetical protein